MRVVPADSQSYPLRSLIGGIYLPALLFGIGQWMIIPTIPQFAGELGASVFLSGLIFAARGAGSMIGDVPSGLLTGRLGGRVTMTAGVLLTAASAAAMGFSATPAMLAGLTLLNGIAFALWHVSRLAYMTETVPVEYRGRALSLVGGVTRVGFFIGPIIGGALGKAGGLETVFFAQAVVVCAAALLVMLRLPRRPRGRRRYPRTRPCEPAQRRPGRTPQPHRGRLRRHHARADSPRSSVPHPRLGHLHRPRPLPDRPHLRPRFRPSIWSSSIPWAW